MISDREKKYLERAIAIAKQGMEAGNGGPFGCVIVRGDEVVGEGCNKVIAAGDPTAHAEVVAIRAACQKLNTYQLSGCEIYTSCEPCPMCLGAIYWARPDRVIFANTKEEAAAIEFDDAFIYHEINTPAKDRRIPFIHFPHPAAKMVFEQWKNWSGKQKY